MRIDKPRLGERSPHNVRQGEDVREIRSQAKTIRQLLGGAKYAIDYYQREYRWESKHVLELLDDLSDRFRESYEADDERSAVAEYSHYFLGSIILSDKEGQKFVIDGQQRLTTLTLLLMNLYRLLKGTEQQGQLAELIFSLKHGKRTFNLDVEERNACMQALYAGESFDDRDQPESVRNMVARYADIEDYLPQQLQNGALPFFVDWLIENVHLIEITAYSDEDAYTIFETMNDRGLSLTPTDMLKGYLLANISDTDRRTAASRIWRDRIQALLEHGKEEDADGIKAWLRSQHAETIRERKRGAKPLDFDLVGTEFHRWVRDRKEHLGLTSGNAFARIIERDFAFYLRWYERLRDSAKIMTTGLECVYYNAQHNFTLQYPVLLAPLRVDDTESDALRKIDVAASFLDILIHRRIWNWRAIDYSTMQYAMFLVIKEIRGRSAAECAQLLKQRLASEPETFATNDSFRLHKMNGRHIKQTLARITDYVGTQAGQTSRYVEYTQSGRGRYEVEHVWADHANRHADEFQHPSDFQEYRNRVGALLLLPKNFNGSYGDLPFPQKRDHYVTQNLLAQSLHEQAYERNPGFIGFLQRSGLKFRPHPEFKKADVDARQALYTALAELIWSADRLDEAARGV